MNHRSTKKTNEPVTEENPALDALFQPTQKGNPDVCMRCQCNVKDTARVTDAYSEHAVCIKCLAIESHMEFVDQDDEVWIAFRDAKIYDKSGRDITGTVRQMADDSFTPVHTNIFRLMEARSQLPTLPSSNEKNEEHLIELRSLLAAIDMALDLGYEDDFMELTTKYKHLIENVKGDDLDGI